MNPVSTSEGATLSPPSSALPNTFLRRLVRAAPDQAGQSIAELAFALPVLFTVIIGVLQYSLVLFTYCNATYACRIAARYASLHSSTSLAPSTSSQIQSLVTSNLFLSSAITPTVNVTYVTPALVSSTNIVGNVVEVTVSWNQTVAIPFMSSKSLSISSQAYRIISR